MARPSGLFEKFRNGNSILVETGTYKGDSIQAALDAGFSKVYSIELDDGRFEFSKKRFLTDSRVEIYNGDSVLLLPRVLDRIDSPSTFWLDAHITKGVYGKFKCPVLLELASIAKHPVKNHTILIDDRRLFNSKRFDMLKEEEVIQYIFDINRAYNVSYEDGLGPRNKHMPKDIIVAQII